MVAPIGDKVDAIEIRLQTLEAKQDVIEDMLKDNEIATVLSLRMGMKSIRDRIVDNNLQPTTGEKSTWKETYKTYYKMGGNNFHDYVDGWGIEMGFTEEELAIFRRDARNEGQKTDK